jgi:hypothetical protein
MSSSTQSTLESGPPILDAKRGVWWLGVLVVVAMILYPPWLHVDAGRSYGQDVAQGLHITVRGVAVETSSGYEWLFTPPSSSRIDFTRLLLQVVIVALLAAWWIWFSWACDPAIKTEEPVAVIKPKQRPTDQTH